MLVEKPGQFQDTLDRTGHLILLVPASHSDTGSS
jgi:hypothetical protein